MVGNRLTHSFHYSTVACALLAIATLAIPKEVNAATITLGQLTFSEYTSGFEITGGVAGLGTKADPFVIYEDVFSGDVTLQIAGLLTLGTNRANTGHWTGFWLRKVVTNKTQEIWDFYDHELQEFFGIASVNGDGLSFAQGYELGRPFTSDEFSQVEEIIDPRDFVNFSNGRVKPGETVTFNYAITDNSPLPVFYLRQRPNFKPSAPDTVLPNPESLPPPEVPSQPEPATPPEPKPPQTESPTPEQTTSTPTTPTPPPEAPATVSEPTSVLSLLGLALWGLSAIARKSEKNP